MKQVSRKLNQLGAAETRESSPLSQFSYSHHSSPPARRPRASFLRGHNRSSCCLLSYSRTRRHYSRLIFPPTHRRISATRPLRDFGLLRSTPAASHSIKASMSGTATERRF